MKKQKRGKKRRKRGRRGRKKRKRIALWERAIPTGYWQKKRGAPGETREPGEEKRRLSLNTKQAISFSLKRGKMSRAMLVNRCCLLTVSIFCKTEPRATCWGGDRGPEESDDKVRGLG